MQPTWMRKAVLGIVGAAVLTTGCTNRSDSQSDTPQTSGAEDRTAETVPHNIPAPPFNENALPTGTTCATQRGESSEEVNGAALLQDGVVQYGLTRFTEPSDEQVSPEVRITIDGQSAQGLEKDQMQDEILMTGEETRRGFDTWGSFEVPAGSSTIRIENIPNTKMPGLTWNEPCVLEIQLDRGPVSRQARSLT